jgi:hypothetical protein
MSEVCITCDAPAHMSVTSRWGTFPTCYAHEDEAYAAQSAAAKAGGHTYN